MYYRRFTIDAECYTLLKPPQILGNLTNKARATAIFSKRIICLALANQPLALNNYHQNIHDDCQPSECSHRVAAGLIRTRPGNRAPKYTTR